MNTNHNLLTIANYASSQEPIVTTSYIYKLIGAKRMNPTIIDGVKFINKITYPSVTDL